MTADPVAATSAATPDPLLDHLTAARWFGGKGRQPRIVARRPLSWLRPPDAWPAVRPEILQIGYPDGDVEHYQMLFSYRPEGDQPEPLVVISGPDSDGIDHGRLAGVDATNDPAMHAALLKAIAHDAKPAKTPDGRHSTRTANFPADLLDPLPPSQVFGGEQSNTSILYGEVALLKIFRRLQPGRNPDIEVHRRLSRVGNDSIAGLLGWLEVDLGDAAGPTDLAMLVHRLPDAEDGWPLALRAVREGEDLTDALAELGAVLAGVHRDLRDQFPTTPIDGAVVADAMTARLDAATTVVPELATMRAELRIVFDRLREHSLDGQRAHGDFHLGQTLRTPTGWKIIDFEGEPAKPMAARIAPDSVWRDIAGLLRSIDYAAAHRKDEIGARWATDGQQAFLDGYRRTSGLHGQQAAGEAELLPAYLVDKAVYEVVYEARNRPDWMPIALAAVRALAERAGS